MAATTTLLGLVTPTQGTLSGTWGDTVNYGITDYVDIAIAGTLSFANDGAITLANTTGSASGNAFTTTTAQYMVIRITGTQSIVKIITGPSYSKLYMVDHAGATSAVTFKAAGQTGVSVAVGEKCFVYYNGTDYVKVATSTGTGSVTSVAGTGTVNGISLSGTVTSSGSLTLGGTLSGVNLASQVTGTLPIANGGTGTSSTTFANLTTNVTGTLPIANGGTGTSSTTFANLTTNVTGTLPVANGGTGAATLTANNVILGNGTSAPLFVAPSSSGNVLTSNGSTWQSTAPSAAGFTLGTPLDTTSGSSFTFGSIPAGVKQIIMTFDRVSLTGNAAKRIRIGDAGGIETTGYESSSCSILSTTIAGSHDTEGFRINSLTNGQRLCGNIVLTLQNASTYTWVASGVLGDGDGSVQVGLFLLGGTKTLSAELTQIQLGQTGGDTFDGGSVNIAYI